MRHSIELALATLSVAGIAYQFLCVWSAASFLRDRRKEDSRKVAAFPPVSILKPVHGADRGAYESFRSHCVLDYPNYEIVFGVNDSRDSAIPFIEQLIKEFPERRIKLVICAQALGTNRKVSNLIQMLSQAQHEYLVVNDGDIRVQPEYLREVMTEFAS